MYNDILFDGEENILEIKSNMESVQKGNNGITKKESVSIMNGYQKGKALSESAAKRLMILGGVKATRGLNEQMVRAIGADLSVRGNQQLIMEYYEAMADFHLGKTMINKANEEMIESMKQFIYYVIERRFNTFKKYKMDLFQEGVIGILRGMDCYNPDKGQPTTYFYHYIVHEMTEFINKNINKTTAHYIAYIQKIKRAINEYEYVGKEWTIEEIAIETQIPIETVRQSIKIMRSMNEIYYDSVTYLDSQMSQRHLSPEDEYLKKEEDRVVHQAISALSKDEQNVIMLKYGMLGSGKMALKNVSQELGIPLDRVRKLNNAGIRKLRKNKNIRNNFKNFKQKDDDENSDSFPI